MGKLFNYDNPVFRVLGKIFDCFYLSILWIVCSLPIITIGASSAALYDTANRVIRHDEGYVAKNFFSVFKGNFKQCTLIWLFHLVLGIIFFADVVISRNALEHDAGGIIGVSYYACYFMLLFDCVWAVYSLAYTTKFELNTKNIIKNAALLAMGNLPWSLLILVMLVVIIIILPYMPFLMLFMPAVMALLFTLILGRIFEKLVKD